MTLLTRWPSERRLFRDPVTGTRIEQLTACPANHWHLSAPETPLTPAGDYLLFTSDRAGGPHPSLFRLEMSAGAIERVTGSLHLDPDSVTPAANGRQAIASLRGEEGEVVALDLETGEWETLAVFLGAELDGCHRSASGEYVVTIVHQEEEATITAVHTEGMRTVPILSVPRGHGLARFSPDSKNSILYVAPASVAIYCVEFDGTGDRVLHSGIQAFRRSGVQESLVRAPECPDTRTPERLNARTPERPSACPPTWLGSGEEVLFIAGTKEGPLLTVPRQGGVPREISPLSCRWVRSNGAGDRVVALASDTIVLIDPRSGDARPLCSGRGAEARPCFSPDGGSVIFSDRDARGYFQLFIAYLDEG
jgi:hypothetical protein